MKRRCRVCWDEPEAKDDWMCKRCAKDYDNREMTFGTNREIAEWAADRARRFERARQKRGN